MNAYKRVIGIDVSKLRLDVADSSGRIPLEVNNDLISIKSKIIKLIKKGSSTLVVCEATGGLEHTLVDALHDAGIDVTVANPAQVRSFAIGHGRLEKSDKIDAQMLQLFGQQVQVSLTKPRTHEERHFTSLMRRREQLVRMIVQERNRLGQCNDEAMKKLIQESIQNLKKQEKLVNSEIEKILAEKAKTDSRIEAMESVPGVGAITVATLVSDLPEIGSISRAKIAKLSGVAPMVRQSGTKDGKRKVRGGRDSVRVILYMATMSAIRCNPVIKAHYTKLAGRGKPGLVVMVACMRKLLTILNDIARSGKKWQQKSVAGATASS